LQQGWRAAAEQDTAGHCKLSGPRRLAARIQSLTIESPNPFRSWVTPFLENYSASARSQNGVPIRVQRLTLFTPFCGTSLLLHLLHKRTVIPAIDSCGHAIEPTGATFPTFLLTASIGTPCASFRGADHERGPLFTNANDRFLIDLQATRLTRVQHRALYSQPPPTESSSHIINHHPAYGMPGSKKSVNRAVSASLASRTRASRARRDREDSDDPTAAARCVELRTS
jgi:hypothetical protein